MIRRIAYLGLFLALIVIAALIFYFLNRGGEYGPEVSLCPGPDHYGYLCQSGTAFAYIDATNDTRLYTDDGTINLEIPFPFTFYGTAYTQVTASTNGNLQFGNSNAAFFNQCMDDGPVSQMGDMVAPYWTDLDLRFFGFLETELVGEAPNRIFVIEWDDIPRFGDESGDHVTFAVQLFESTNDMLVFYQDVTTGVDANGRFATIGLQSEAQGLALQFGCNQAIVPEPSQLLFAHPENPNGSVGLSGAFAPTFSGFSLAAKGRLAETIDALAQDGEPSLQTLKTVWLNQSPTMLSDWRWLDLTGDGNDELFILWRSTAQQPQLTELAVLAEDANGRFQPLLVHTPNGRDALSKNSRLQLIDVADLTGDGMPDILLHDELSGELLLVSDQQVLVVPEQCSGGVVLNDLTEDGVPEIIRDGCDIVQNNGRFVQTWRDNAFQAP